MKQFLLDTTKPLNESCIKVGSPNYSAFAKLEANALINQFKRILGNPPEGGKLSLAFVKAEDGEYYDVSFEWPEDSAACLKYKENLYIQFPENWDEQALEELEKSGYRLVKESFF